MPHRALWACAGAFLLVTPLLAHDDDPKILDRIPPVEGPGFRPGADTSYLGGGGSAFPASGIQLLSWLPLSQLDGASSGNDCWGYVSPSGREYALMGTRNGTVFVEITDPSNPQVVDTIAGPSSLWRDIKTYQNYAYAVSEGGSGIQVMNLAGIDSGNVSLVNTINDDSESRTHNVVIDTESGFLYRTGGGNNGLRIYSLANPAAPSRVGTWSTRYIHDAQAVSYTSGPLAGREIVFACSGFNGGGTNTGLDVLDVTNKSSVQVLSNVQYSQAAYSHQGWLSADRQYFYLGDELDEDGSLTTRTIVIDVSNPLSGGAFEVTDFTNGNQAIGHNLYTVGDLIYEANYTSGLRVFDASVNATNPPEIASFDTVPANDNDSFNGLWNVYPFFPSGVVIGSDLESGLFVWWVGDPLLELALPAGVPDLLDPNGDVLGVQITESSPGVLAAGTEKLVYDAGAGPVEVDLIDLGGGAYNAVFPPFSCGTNVSWYVKAESTNNITWTFPQGAPALVTTSTAATSQVIAESYEMEANQGWSSGAAGDDATTGIWTRGNPIGTDAQAEDDHTPSGIACWFTGQGSPGGSVGENDVDNGTTTLLSPVMDLSALDDPVISYWRWYSNNAGTTDDVFEIDLSVNGGSNWISVEDIGPTGEGTSGGWIFHSFVVSDFAAPSSQVRMRFRASDLNSGSIVEAAIDDFQVSDFECDDSLGVRICSPGVSNSTGQPGRMNVDGSTVVTDDDLVLSATNLPTNSNIGYFIMGAGTNTFTPPGSAGPICITPGLLRILPPVSNTNELPGGFSRPVGTSGAQTSSITPGSTWGFQAWHRDSMAGTSNLTDAIRVTFQ